MDLKQCRLVTEDVQQLTSFYETITGAVAEVFSRGYVEFQHSPSAGLAITSAETASVYGDGVAIPGANRSAIIDFEVEDVDAHFARLKDKVGDWIFEPTTMPWGNRAMAFRDPDGNLINIFAQRAVAEGQAT